MNWTLEELYHSILRFLGLNRLRFFLIVIPLSRSLNEFGFDEIR